MPAYKLYYFPAKARGEVIRWLFEIGGIDYEDIRLSDDMWQEFKPKTPFGQMPVLEVDGVFIAQSNAIARFVAKRIGMAGKTDLEQARVDMVTDCINDTLKLVQALFYAKDEQKEELKKQFEDEQKPTSLGYFERFCKDDTSGFLVGDSMTWADVLLVNGLTFMRMVGDVNLDNFPLIKALEDKVTSHPKVADWIKRRPETAY